SNAHWITTPEYTGIRIAMWTLFAACRKGTRARAHRSVECAGGFLDAPGRCLDPASEGQMGISAAPGGRPHPALRRFFAASARPRRPLLTQKKRGMPLSGASLVRAK